MRAEDWFDQAWKSVDDEQLTGGFYFAYGANLNRADMEFRCPDAKPIASARIPHFRMVFRGCCDVEPHENSTAHGALWSISKRDERALDGFEGYPYFYRKERLMVQTDSIGVVEAMVYMMNALEEDHYSLPGLTYVETVKNGYEDWGLPMEALQDALQDALERSRGVTFRASGKRLLPVEIPDEASHHTNNATREDWESGLVEDHRDFLPGDCEACGADMGPEPECDTCGWDRRVDPFVGMSPATRMLEEKEREHEALQKRQKVGRLRKRGNRRTTVVQGVDADGNIFAIEGGQYELAKALAEGAQ